MASDFYQTDGKTFLKCKECGEYKELIGDYWYSHKEGFMGVMGRCKECIKRGRSSERERELAREFDRKRFKENPQRREYSYQAAKKRAQRHNEMGEERNKNHGKTDRLIKKLGVRPKKCPICGKEGRILAHHPKIEIWWEVVFCCQICHSAIHSGKITDYKIIELKHEETREEFLERKNKEVMEKIRLLRKMSLPPAWMDQSPEAIEKWHNMED